MNNSSQKVFNCSQLYRERNIDACWSPAEH